MGTLGNHWGEGNRSELQQSEIKWTEESSQWGRSIYCSAQTGLGSKLQRSSGPPRLPKVNHTKPGAAHRTCQRPTHAGCGFVFLCYFPHCIHGTAIAGFFSWGVRGYFCGLWLNHSLDYYFFGRFRFGLKG